MLESSLASKYSHIILKTLNFFGHEPSEAIRQGACQCRTRQGDKVCICITRKWQVKILNIHFSDNNVYFFMLDNLFLVDFFHANNFRFKSFRGSLLDIIIRSNNIDIFLSSSSIWSRLTNSSTSGDFSTLKSSQNVNFSTVTILPFTSIVTNLTVSLSVSSFVEVSFKVEISLWR